jgi:hypothetical protein
MISSEGNKHAPTDTRGRASALSSSLKASRNLANIRVSPSSRRSAETWLVHKNEKKTVLPEMRGECLHLFRYYEREIPFERNHPLVNG